MATINSLAQDIKDILDIINTAILPALGKLHNGILKLQESDKFQNDRLDRMEKKLDRVTEIVTISQKTTDSRLRVLESKKGIFHD